MSDELKLCRDCAHYEQALYSTILGEMKAKCLCADMLSEPDIVTGVRARASPREAREDKSMCGIEARHFVQKVSEDVKGAPWWKFW